MMQPSSFRFNDRSVNNRGVYPPIAFAEIYRNDASALTKIRRLHLLVVDLEKTKSVSNMVYWQYQKINVSANYEECFNTLPVPIADAESPLRCRYVYGYGVDGSDRPSYLLWPRRGSDGHFWLIEPKSGDFFDSKPLALLPLGWNISLMLLPSNTRGIFAWMQLWHWNLTVRISFLIW